MSSNLAAKSERDRVEAEFRHSTDENVVDFVQGFRNEDIKNPNARNRTISDVSERETSDIRNLLGLDVTGYKHNLSGSAVKHIEVRHGINGKADQSMADANNYGRIGYVLRNYDIMELLRTSSGDLERNYGILNSNGEPAPMIRYAKRVNGNFYVVEAVPEAKSKRLQIVSAYIQ